MPLSSPIIPLVARVLLGAIFLIAGLSKLGDVQGFTQYMVAGGVPAIFAWPAIALEIVGGLAVIVGFHARLAGLALAIFSVATAMLYHFDPTSQIEMQAMMKNLAMAGGYLLLFHFGAGPLSVDARQGRA